MVAGELAGRLGQQTKPEIIPPPPLAPPRMPPRTTGQAKLPELGSPFAVSSTSSPMTITFSPCPTIRLMLPYIAPLSDRRHLVRRSLRPRDARTAGRIGLRPSRCPRPCV